MAVTNGDVALALGLVAAADAPLDAGLASVLGRIRAQVESEVDAYAPVVPADVRDQAVIVYAGYAYEQRGRAVRPRNMFVSSGAQAMLAPWRSVSVTAAAAASVPAGPAPAEGAGLPAGGASGNLLVRGAAAMSGLWRSLADVLRGRVGTDELATAVTETLNGAVQVESVEISGTDIVMSSGGGGSETLALAPVVDARITDQVPPARRVPASAGADDADKVLKLDGAGANPAWRVDATAQGGGGGLDAAAVDGRIDARIPVARRVPASAGSGDADKVLKLDGAGANPAWRDDAEGSGGLSQSQVDGRVNALVPAARRVPASAGADDADKVLKLDGAGANPAWREDAQGSGGGGSVTRQSVYGQAKEIVQAGSGVTVTPDDAARTITLKAGVASGAKLPSNPSIGDRFILTADDTIEPVRTEYGLSAPNRTQYPIQTGNGPAWIAGYSLGADPASVRNKVFIIFSGRVRPKSAATLLFGRAGGTLRTYQIADDPLGDGYPHWYEVAGLAYDDIDDTEYQFSYRYVGGTGGPRDFGGYVYTGADYPASIAVQAGDLTYAGGDHGEGGWIRTPGVAAAWAVQGRPEPRTLLALTTLIDGAGIGLTITGFSNAVAPVFQAFVPSFDLDDAANQVGIIEVEATLTVSTRSSGVIGFDNYGLQSLRKTAFTFASELLAGNIDLLEWPIFAGGTLRNPTAGQPAGTLKLRLAKNAANVAGYDLSFEVDNSRTNNGNCSIGLQISAVFLHNDGVGEGLPASAGAADANRVLKLDAAGGSPAWRVDAGLDVAAVNALIPPARRVPSPAGLSDAGKALQLDSSGANPAWRTLPASNIAVIVGATASTSGGSGWLDPFVVTGSAGLESGAVYALSITNPAGRNRYYGGTFIFRDTDLPWDGIGGGTMNLRKNASTNRLEFQFPSGGGFSRGPILFKLS